jgi:hypothetical protein
MDLYGMLYGQLYLYFIYIYIYIYIYLLGYNVVKFGDIPAFRRNLSPPNLESKSRPSMKLADFSELHDATISKTVLLISAGFLLGLVFDSEDGGIMLLRNVRLSPNYTALRPRRNNSSFSLS